MCVCFEEQNFQMDAFKILIAQLATNLSEPTEEHSEIQNPKNKENAKKKNLTRLGIEPRTTCVMITMIVILLSRCDNHCFNVR
jgi:hypothetical protein